MLNRNGDCAGHGTGNGHGDRDWSVNGGRGIIIGIGIEDGHCNGNGGWNGCGDGNEDAD